jgi:predicted signal transduction protein with EAL and GGDEF domain
VLAAAAGAAFGDRPTLGGGLALVAAVALVPLLFRALATRIRAVLDGALAEQASLRVELDDAHRTKQELRDLAYHDDLTGAPFRFDGHELTIGASVGVSVYPGEGTSADELMGSADAAMYRDKHRSVPTNETTRGVEVR